MYAITGFKILHFYLATKKKAIDNSFKAHQEKSVTGRDDKKILSTSITTVPTSSMTEHTAYNHSNQASSQEYLITSDICHDEIIIIDEKITNDEIKNPTNVYDKAAEKVSEFAEQKNTNNPLQAIPNAKTDDDIDQFPHSGIRCIDIKDLHIDKEALLGKGAFGSVFKGVWLGTSVAVKEIQIKTRKDNADAIDSMKRELSVAGMLRHPNIVQTMAYAMNKNGIHLINELIDGYNLDDILFDGDINIQLSVSTKIGIARQVTAAIAYMHGNTPPLIHQDLKPANIMLSTATSYSQAKVCDFGLGRLRNLHNISCSKAYMFEGTPRYMAPECLLLHKIGRESSDIWSLGCVLVELLTEQSIWKSMPLEEFIEHVGKAQKDLKLPDGAKKIANKYKKAVHACLQYVSDERVTAIQVLNLLPAA